jgi:hypothetical protein
MKKSVAFIAAAAFAFSFLSLSLTSCDSFNGGQNFAADGAICVRLPDQSQLAGQAAAEKLSGSVSSDGTLNGASVDSFKVTVRNVALKTETSQTVAPGSIVTIDKLSEGSYDVAVFGYGADSQANPSYYGNARAVAVTAGKTSTANVVLSRLTERPGVSFAFSAVDLQYAFLTYSCDEMGKSGEVFYSFTTPGGTDLVKPPMPVFMEPGYNYKVKVVFYGMSSEAKYICSAEGVVPASGGLVSGSASDVDKGFVPWTNYTAPLLLGNSPADYFKDNVSFSLEGESVPAEDVSFHAINDKACGFTVPFIASYQEYSCLLMPSVVHPVTAPNVSVADMQVPKGETKEVAVSYNPPAPVNWPVLGQLPDTQNGFTSYGVTGYDSDTWQGEADCPQSYSNYIKASDDKKSIIGIDVSPSPCPCVWTVSVTHGAHGQMNDTSASANFNVSCVEAASSGGGGGSVNYPPDPNWFSFQSTPEVLPEGTQGAAEVIYNNVSNGTRLLYPAPTPRYVKFGNYPRTHKAASVNIDESVYQTMGNFTYYKGDDNNWYAKFQVKKNSSTTYYNNGTDTIEATSNYAYFKLEPITWRVLTTNYKGTGKALLVTDEALPGYFDYANSPGHKAFAFVYNSDYSTPNRTYRRKDNL